MDRVELKQKILDLFAEVLPDIDFESSDTLVDDGIFDSISIVTAVSELSMEFNVNFDINQLGAENLNSIESIVDTVLGLMNSKK